MKTVHISLFSADNTNCNIYLVLLNAEKSWINIMRIEINFIYLQIIRQVQMEEISAEKDNFMVSKFPWTICCYLWAELRCHVNTVRIARWSPTFETAQVWETLQSTLIHTKIRPIQFYLTLVVSNSMLRKPLAQTQPISCSNAINNCSNPLVLIWSFVPKGCISRYTDKP